MKRGTLFNYAFKKSTSNQPPLETKRRFNLRLTESDCDEETAVEENKKEEDVWMIPMKTTITMNHDGIDVDDAKAKKKTRQKFRDAWTITWPWLLDLPDGMRCQFCTSGGEDNALTRPGCDNFKTTTFKRHVSSRLVGKESTLRMKFASLDYNCLLSI